jgi:hypothetical protein
MFMLVHPQQLLIGMSSKASVLFTTIFLPSISDTLWLMKSDVRDESFMVYTSDTVIDLRSGMTKAIWLLDHRFVTLLGCIDLAF